MISFLLVASAALILAAMLLRRSANQQLAGLGFQNEVVYMDGDDEVLISDTHRLVGKPDYILRTGEELIPVERKSRKLRGGTGYDGEILQLAAYCLLVEEKYGVQVRRGQLQYSDRAIDVSFTPDLRCKLQSALAALRESKSLIDVPRSHDSPARCRSCGFRSRCTSTLAC
jgi:CRISPR-associated exonuclease Cas4